MLYIEFNTIFINRLISQKTKMLRKSRDYIKVFSIRQTEGED